MSTGDIRAIADAVLREGYVLYPYRASSTKNRFRWIFGVLAPRAWSEAGGCEPWWMETQLLIRPGDAAGLDCMLRFLQVRRRRVERAVSETDSFQPVESLEADGRLFVSWDEGETRELSFQDLLSGSQDGHLELPFETSASHAMEPVRSSSGELLGRVVRQQMSVRGSLRVSVQRVSAEQPLLRVSLRIENTTPWKESAASRDEILPSCCIGTHLLLSLSGATFVSAQDPPDWALSAAAGCRNTRLFPVLLGSPESQNTMLASPIILYDYPRIAPESPGDFFDAAEIDELLALRTANLTEDEKRQARATDAEAAAIVDRVEALPPAVMERLHGAIRDLERAEMVPRASRTPQVLQVGATAIGPGARVRLRPGSRRTDAQDLLYAGRIARVEEIRHDVDGRDYLGVTIEDDPAAELHRWYGRMHYYLPDEVEPLPPEEKTP